MLRFNCIPTQTILSHRATCFLYFHLIEVLFLVVGHHVRTVQALRISLHRLPPRCCFSAGNKCVGDESPPPPEITTPGAGALVMKVHAT